MKIFLSTLALLSFALINGCVLEHFVFDNEYFHVLRAPDAVDRSHHTLTLSDSAVVALETPDSDFDLDFTLRLKRGSGFFVYLRSNVQETEYTKGVTVDVTNDIVSCDGVSFGRLHQSPRDGCEFHFTTDGAQVWLVAGSKERGYRKYFHKKTDVTATYRVVFAPKEGSEIEITDLDLHSTLNIKR